MKQDGFWAFPIYLFRDCIHQGFFIRITIKEKKGHNQWGKISWTLWKNIHPLLEKLFFAIAYKTAVKASLESSLPIPIHYRFKVELISWSGNFLY